MLQELIDNNAKWVNAQNAHDEHYFEKLSQGQSPEIMLIGCCDSRFPFEVITGSEPGDIFVHRNIANLVQTDDDDVVSAIEFAVKVLNVKHIVVCGHYECGGIRASLEPVELEHVNKHIAPVIELKNDHKSDLAALDSSKQFDTMVELNVAKQCENVHALDFVNKSIQNTSYPHLHGWVFDIRTGQINNLHVNNYDE